MHAVVICRLCTAAVSECSTISTQCLLFLATTWKLLHGLIDTNICVVCTGIMSYDEVEIEDMKWDEQLKAYTYPCPCGDLFQITLVRTIAAPLSDVEAAVV